MSDDVLVKNGAPTLAGLKTASLFTCECGCREELLASVRGLNRRFRNKGLRVLPLRFSENKALIYLYRPRMLSEDLTRDSAAELLRQRGYGSAKSEGCLVELIRRLRSGEEFPHEIGLFLGYPVEDVRGFIANNACGCKCVGCWKVYGDAESARKRFELYRKCSRVYWDCWAKGTDIERLAVAG